ncbi:unnamed protein product [Calypogeia fissa]
MYRPTNQQLHTFALLATSESIEYSPITPPRLLSLALSLPVRLQTPCPRPSTTDWPLDLPHLVRSFARPTTTRCPLLLPARPCCLPHLSTGRKKRAKLQLPSIPHEETEDNRLDLCFRLESLSHQEPRLDYGRLDSPRLGQLVDDEMREPGWGTGHPPLPAPGQMTKRGEKGPGARPEGLGWAGLAVKGGPDCLRCAPSFPAHGPTTWRHALGGWGLIEKNA